jgi:hypothetical protein
MKGQIYSVHENPDLAEPSARVVLVREGYAFWAFVFHFFWLAAHRCWRASALVLLAMAAIEVLGMRYGLSKVSLLVLQFGLQFCVGAMAHDMCRAALARSGFREVSIVCAESELLAERRYFDRLVVA